MISDGQTIWFNFIIDPRQPKSKQFFSLSIFSFFFHHSIVAMNAPSEVYSLISVDEHKRDSDISIIFDALIVFDRLRENRKNCDDNDK